MFIIFDYHEKKVLDTYADRSKAILARNYFEHEISRIDPTLGMFRKDMDILVIEIPEPRDLNNTDETWTDINLEDAPLDFIIEDPAKHLKPNNWMHKKIDEENKKAEEIRVQNKNKLDCEIRIVEESMEKIKNTYSKSFRGCRAQKEEKTKQLESLHARVIETKKKVRKNLATQQELDAISKSEKELRKEIGKVKMKESNLRKRCVRELKHMIAGQGVYCNVYEDYDYDGSVGRVLTVYATSRTYHLCIL